MNDTKGPRSGGTCVIVGMVGEEIKLPLSVALSREVDLKGLFRYFNDYQSALDLVSTSDTGLKKLVIHYFDTKEAFETARHGEGNAISVDTCAKPR